MKAVQLEILMLPANVRANNNFQLTHHMPDRKRYINIKQTRLWQCSQCIL